MNEFRGLASGPAGGRAAFLTAAFPTKALRTAGAAALLATLAGCAPGVLDPVGPVGAAERQILINSLAIMLVIVVPTILLTLGFAWWFRAGNARATYRPNWEFSGQIELVVWSVPLMTVMLLGGVSWVGSHDLDPFKPLPSEQSPLEVQVVSMDWKWLFIYPEQKVALVNELVMPVGRPVHFTLTSSTVMNSFFVPQMGTMIYTMAGMSSQVSYQADKAGTYMGLSTHFSGDGFPDMRFQVRAVPDAEFASWAAGAAAGTGKVLDDAEYNRLNQQSTNDKPATYRAVSDGLYDRVVSFKLPPGPGPKPAVVPKGNIAEGNPAP